MIDGGSFGLASAGHCCRAAVHRLQEPGRHRASHGCRGEPYQETATIELMLISSGADATVFPLLAVWPLAFVWRHGHRFGSGAAEWRVQCHVVAAAAAASPAYCCRHRYEYSIADYNTRCLRLDSRSWLAVSRIVYISFCSAVGGSDEREEVLMTGIGFSTLKRAVIGYRLSPICAAQSCHCWIIAHH